MKNLFALVLIASALVGCGQSKDYDKQPQYGSVPCWNTGAYSTNCQGLYAYSGYYDQRYWRPYSYWSNGGTQYYAPYYSSNWQSYYNSTSSYGYGSAYSTTTWSNPYGYAGCSSYSGYAPVYLNSGIACYYVGMNQYQWQYFYWHQIEGSNQYSYRGNQNVSYDGMLKGCGGDNGGCPTGRCSSRSQNGIGVCLVQ